jgi:hypothetical protein
VGLIMPTGFSVSNSPVTTSGDLTVAFAAGYTLPTTAKQSQWDSAYSFTSTFPTGSAFQLLRYNTLGTALEFFTPSYLTPVDIIATTPLVWNSGTKTMSIPVANNTTDGYLSSADWLTFSSKQPAITLTTTGNSGPSTFNVITGALNVPEYTLLGLGGFYNPMTTTGDIIVGRSTGEAFRFGGNITTTRKFFSQIGDGSAVTSSSWYEITTSNLGAVPTSRTLTINGTAYDLTADRSWSVGTVTSLTGEATASGSGAVAVTLTNSAVIGKVLTGLNVTGGTVIATDSILTAFGKLQNQVNGLAGGVTYQGGWNASTNSPALSSGTGTKGYYYVVTTAGSTNLDGITDWKLGDWAIYNGSVWEKVDNTDSVSSVNGFTGAVSLTTANISENTNLYYTDTRSRLAVSLTTTGSSGAATYNNTTGVFNVPQYTLSGLGGVPSSRQITINGVTFDLSADRTYTIPTHDAVTLGTANGLSLSGQVLSLGLASGSANGALSSTDWTTFNNKQAALNGTGFVKISGTTISYDNSTYYLASNPSNYIALTNLSAGAGITYNNTTGVIASSITQYTDALARAAISETITGIDYNNTTGVFSTTTGYAIPTTSSQTNWDAAYNDKINSASVSGTTTKTLTLNQQDGGTITASWTDINTDAVTSVFGRTGVVVATNGDYNTSQVTENVANLYFTNARARSAISLTTTGSSGSSTYDSGTGVLNVPTYTAAGLGAVPTTRTLTINDVPFDLSADRSWSVGDFGTW